LRAIVLARNPLGWVSNSLSRELGRQGFEARVVSTRSLRVELRARGPAVAVDGAALGLVDAVLARVLGLGPIEHSLYALDALSCLEASGALSVNTSASMRSGLSKLAMLLSLRRAGLPCPETIVPGSLRPALGAFQDLDGDLIVKPMVGARGVGVARVRSPVAFEHALEETAAQGRVPMLQRFVEHGGEDTRILVVGDGPVAAMRRVSGRPWTNISRGGVPVPLSSAGEAGEMAVKASRAMGCDYSGVDIASSSQGLFILEVNTQPDYAALQSATGVDVSKAIVNLVRERLRR